MAMTKKEQMFNDAPWLLEAIEHHDPNVSVKLAYSVRNDLKVKYVDGQPLIALTLQKNNLN